MLNNIKLSILPNKVIEIYCTELRTLVKPIALCTLLLFCTSPSKNGTNGRMNALLEERTNVQTKERTGEGTDGRNGRSGVRDN